MSDMFLEIIELDDGQIALRRADSDDEPIMKISFSDDVREQMDGDCIDIAKVMLTAGIHMISDLNVKAASEIETNEEPAEEAPRTIH
ncbi:hypothetical protein [Amphritea balenae]|uniref:Uncharacterized protein n=1 Tax=Amphritea balenae TaxID=452629 RepID=A0A3P1SLF2_9GAMM|nr:hypothetical protein [Amphritea balenae]RRC97779.1 hypothetical protein EHS89_16510 [Amphritea balenae]GGK82941.1 hypothetical protein GCM10007941_36790 [Amphritea balenae]